MNGQLHYSFSLISDIVENMSIKKYLLDYIYGRAIIIYK